MGFAELRRTTETLQSTEKDKPENLNRQGAKDAKEPETTHNPFGHCSLGLTSIAAMILLFSLAHLAPWRFKMWFAVFRALRVSVVNEVYT